MLPRSMAEHPRARPRETHGERSCERRLAERKWLTLARRLCRQPAGQLNDMEDGPRFGRASRRWRAV